jgi:hypothetical protein
MSRNAPLALAILASVVAASLAATSRATAAPAAGAICKPFTTSGLKITWETIGSWTCGSAKRWVETMSKDRDTKPLTPLVLHNGPSGLHCIATDATSKGLVKDGLCYAGTLAFPKSGFSWDGS